MRIATWPRKLFFVHNLTAVVTRHIIECFHPESEKNKTLTVRERDDCCLLTINPAELNSRLLNNVFLVM